MSRNNKSFFSKILLTGEYAVTMGGQAIAVPYSKYKGSFDFMEGTDQRELNKLFAYLQENGLEKYYDLNRIKADLNAGLHFVSNIPIGYGLGSSGAVIAALYDRYNIYQTTQIDELKEILAKTECAFHRISSGMDPLVSYINQPICFSSGNIEIIPEASLDLQNFYLFDSGISRSTSQFMDIFNKKLQTSKEFNRKMELLKDLNSALIEAMKAGHADDISIQMRLISLLQLDCFQEMITEETLSLWKEGLLFDEYYMKLCGAGGGGMYLVWAKNHQALKFPVMSLL